MTPQNRDAPEIHRSDGVIPSPAKQFARSKYDTDTSLPTSNDTECHRQYAPLFHTPTPTMSDHTINPILAKSFHLKGEGFEPGEWKMELDFFSCPFWTFGYVYSP
jgi:hypothetical protein